MAREGADLPDPLIVGNIGYYLLGNGIESLRKRLGYRHRPSERMRLFFSRLGWFGIALPVGLITAVILFAAAFAIGTIEGAAVTALLLVLLALPASEAAMGIFNLLSTYMVRPYHMPGYEFRKGIPAEARTLVVIPCMIGDRDTIDELVRNLEVHYLANPNGETYFALLSDWPDAAEEQRVGDQELLDYAQGAIDELAETYAHTGRRRFFLLHRRRTYNQVDDVWMGWERKRGKLEELFDLLRGETHTTYLTPGHRLPEAIAFVLTLDSDTRLPRDTVTKLVGKMAHPLNAPINDPATERVTGGYGILQPRITASLTTGEEASTFQRIFSANRGLDPYVFAVSDTYQDVFREGSFTGKGLIPRRCIPTGDGRPDRRQHRPVARPRSRGRWRARALVTDIEFVEDFPTKYSVEVSRQHRWIRGDWQLLPFIFGRHNGISALNRFKMVDNLRRSLLPIAWVLASIVGWTKFGVRAALVWQCVLVAMLIIAPTVSLLTGFVAPPVGVTTRSHLRTYGWELLVADGPDRPADRAHGPHRLVCRRRDRAHALPAVRVAPPAAGVEDGGAGSQELGGFAARLCGDDVAVDGRRGRAASPSLYSTATTARWSRCPSPSPGSSRPSSHGRCPGRRRPRTGCSSRRPTAERSADWRAGPGAISRPSSTKSTTICRRTISRRIRSQSSPAGPRRPISGST